MNLVRSFSWKGFSKEKDEFMLAISQPALIRLSHQSEQRGAAACHPVPTPRVNAQDPRPRFASWPL